MRKRRSEPQRPSYRSDARAFHATVDEALDEHGPVWIPQTWINTLIGLGLVPLIWITGRTFWETLSDATLVHAFWRSAPFWFFALGMAMWVITYVGLRGPAMVWLYVFGHEWTHAMFAKLWFAEVLEAPVVTSRGGHVVTTKNNIFISLSPYFFPFYSVIIGIVYVLLRMAFDMGPFSEKVVYTLIGFSWSFHITFTFWMVIRSQPDLQQNGTFFSLTFILLVNLLIVTALLVFASPSVDWGAFLAGWWKNGLELGGKVAGFLGIR